MSTQPGSANVRQSQLSVTSGHSMNLTKTLHVQDQIIEQLRADQTALREALEVERLSLRDARASSDREIKLLQRENGQLQKMNKQHEAKIEELTRELSFAKEALSFEQKNFRNLEKEHLNSMKDLKLKISRDFDKISKQEMIIDQLKSEVEDLKEALQSERNAANLLIREHNAEVKMLREEVKTKSTEAYRDLKERATREREEYREMQEEAERTYKVLEKDFRDALAAKEEEIRKVKAEAKLIQKELEDQLRASLKEPNPVQQPVSLGTNDYIEMAKFRRLKNELSVLKEQNRKLLNEIQILTDEGKINELSVTGNYMTSYPNSSQTFDSSHAIKVGDRPKKSLPSVRGKGSDVEIARLSSEHSVTKTYSKRQSRSAMSVRRDDVYRPHTKSKTEERYEELKRTMQILRRALQ